MIDLTMDYIDIKPPLSNEQMVLANHYAGLAMQALITTIRIGDFEEYNYDAVAKDAFKFAEAMVRYEPK